MNIDTYQAEARKTALSQAGTDPYIVALLGLAGETGELLSEYKKHLRDGASHRLFTDRVREELGDLLWYVARTADLFNLTLSDVASDNLRKALARFGDAEGETSPVAPRNFDAVFPPNERLPRQMEVELRQIDDGGSRVIHTFVNGERRGDDLTDNAHVSDGYRFHDVFHFSYAAVLGWSPVVRLILKCKRRSRPEIDEIEDGGRAKVIEEGISALVFSYAIDHSYLDGIRTIDLEILRLLQKMTSHLEVGTCSPREWESAILQGFEVWRRIHANGGGRFLADLDNRTIKIRSAHA